MDLKGRKVLVVGLGRTGVSLARFLCSRGASVAVTDVRSPSELRDSLKGLEGVPVTLELGGHRVETFLRSELIVLSPGVPVSTEPVREAEEKGIEVISEIELAHYFIKAPVIAVTGTNGKTTTTSLLYEVFSRAGKKVWVGGNIGRPLIDLPMEGDEPEYVICEVSSFQLERIRGFRPFIGILLNITEDHMDRYGSLVEYGRTKFRLFTNQRASDYAIVNGDDPLISSLLSTIPSRIVRFSSRERLPDGAYMDAGKVVFSRGGSCETYSFNGIALKGRHNLENIMSAVTAARICGLDKDVILGAVRDFRGLPHRIEFVREWKGVHYYNDSKATNPGAVIRAVESMDSPVILLLGGKDKGMDYRVLNRVLGSRVRVVVLFGEAQEKIAASLNPSVDIRRAGDLEEAVAIASKEARSGEVVLLSPASSSFDAFRSYEERGERFKELVMALK